MVVLYNCVIGMGWAAVEKDIWFYDNAGCITGINLIWSQVTLTTLVQIFEQVGMYTNLGNTNAMTYSHGFIWGKMDQDTCKKKNTSEHTKFGERKWTRVICSECGVTTAASSIRNHTERTHERSLKQNRDVDT